jgi:hypothetical protein
MSALSDSYVARVLFKTHRPAGALDAIARRWRWLRDPYRPELHYMRALTHPDRPESPPSRGNQGAGIRVD